MALVRRRQILLASIALAIAFIHGCATTGDAGQPSPTELVTVPISGAQRSLVVVLPGRGDDLAGLRRTGIVEAIQSAWPDADVLLAGVAFAYYLEGRMPERLHDEVLAKYQQRGYREIWLAGASMGGMGTLVYDLRYPGEMTGLVLMAPYLGGRETTDPRESEALKEIWHYVKSWGGKQGPRPGQVWLTYGDTDSLGAVMPPLVSLLPANHVLLRPGGHAWSVWSPAAKEIFSRIRREY